MQRNFGSPGLAVRPDDPGPANNHFHRIVHSGALEAARRGRRAGCWWLVALAGAFLAAVLLIEVILEAALDGFLVVP